MVGWGSQEQVPGRAIAGAHFLKLPRLPKHSDFFFLRLEFHIVFFSLLKIYYILVIIIAVNLFSFLFLKNSYI